MNDDRNRDRERKVRREFMAKVKQTLGRAPFVEPMISAYLCAIDPATPKRTKAVLLGALIYFIMPLDAIPDGAVPDNPVSGLSWASCARAVSVITNKTV